MLDPRDQDHGEQEHKRIGFAIFHDGNPGHLWRGGVASSLGEAVLSAGVVMWLAALTWSPQVVALAVAALGLPFLLAGPLGARLENRSEPGKSLKVIGRLRIVLALALIPMHYYTILPVVYALLFAISLCGRLNDALRTAVARTCLAPGELEHVANDMHIGSALAAVIGPLLATACYVLVGERILLVSVATATIFLLSVNSEGFLDALPRSRRDFLLATPESASTPDEWEHSRVFALEDGVATGALAETLDDDLDPQASRDATQEARELQLPPWYQQGPRNAWQALADIRAGLGLAGATSASATALWAIGALSLVGGGLAVLEVFYLYDRFGLPSLYLGPLLACESAGLALGALLAGDARAGHSGRSSGGGARSRLLGGVLGVGAALAVLAAAPLLPVALAASFALGAANALAVLAARRALLSGFDGVEQRALAASEAAVAALCGMVGALVFAKFYVGVSGSPLAGWPISELFVLTGGSLVLAAFVFAVLMMRKPSVPAVKAAGKAGEGGEDAASASLTDDDELDDDEFGDSDDLDDRIDDRDNDRESAYLPASDRRRTWDERRSDWTGHRPARRGDTADAYDYSEAGYRQPTRGANNAYDEAYDDTDDDQAYDDESRYDMEYEQGNDDDGDGYDEPPSRRGAPPPGPRGRSARRNPRPRW